MTIKLDLTADTIRQLTEKAALAGQSLEAYLEQLAMHDVAESYNGTASAETLSDEEFESLLDDLSSGSRSPHLRADFSRADIH